MKIGILGGTFNPPHIGHLILAQEVYQKLWLDKIFFIPMDIAPHKESHNVSSLDRLRMVKLALGKDKRFEVLDLEQVKGSLLMGRVQKEFAYSAATDKGEQKTGSVFAATIEDAKKLLEDLGLISVTLEEVEIGRENPFAPYYTPSIPTINTKTK